MENTRLFLEIEKWIEDERNITAQVNRDKKKYAAYQA
jgi:hypothetical protein